MPARKTGKGVCRHHPLINGERKCLFFILVSMECVRGALMGLQADPPSITLRLPANVSAVSLRALSEAIRHANHLGSVNLHTTLGDDGCRELVGAALRNPSVRRVHLVDYSIGTDGAWAVAEALRASRVEVLDLIGLGMEDEGCRAFAGVLAGGCSHLRSLHLSSNSIGGVGIQALTGALRTNHTLSFLSFSCNFMTVEGADHVARLVASNTPHLLRLELFSCGIGDDEALVLAQGLRNAPVLRELDLGGNRIQHRGTRELAQALRQNTVLQSLELAGNPIGGLGVVALADALRENHTLTHLDLGGMWDANEQQAMVQIEERIQTNRKHRKGWFRVVLRQEERQKVVGSVRVPSRATSLEELRVRIGDEVPNIAQGFCFIAGKGQQELTLAQESATSVGELTGLGEEILVRTSTSSSSPSLHNVRTWFGNIRRRLRTRRPPAITTTTTAAAAAAAPEVPVDFLDVITLEIMKDPVVCADGHTYERASIEAWLREHSTSPKTNEPLSSLHLTPNHTLRALIQAYQEEQCSLVD